MNPFLHKLGYSPTDRVVVLHADDIGMCHSTLLAYDELLDAGLISSAAVMMPCPWSNAAGQLCQQHADHPGLDMGVHLTLTSEWTDYRWRPLSTADPASGLLDDEATSRRWLLPCRPTRTRLPSAQNLSLRLSGRWRPASTSRMWTATC